MEVKVKFNFKSGLKSHLKETKKITQKYLTEIKYIGQSMLKHIIFIIVN